MARMSQMMVAEPAHGAAQIPSPWGSRAWSLMVTSGQPSFPGPSRRPSLSSLARLPPLHPAFKLAQANARCQS